MSKPGEDLLQIQNLVMDSDRLQYQIFPLGLNLSHDSQNRAKKAA
jgi:hypothetical protein